MALAVLSAVLPLAWVACTGVVLLFLWKLLNLELIIKYRRIPGPVPSPVLGNLGQFRSHGPVKMMKTWSRMYGPVFKVWFGARLFVVLNDVDLARSAMNKNINHAPFLSLMMRRLRQMDEVGLVAARDGFWKLARSAWQPAFSSGSLSGYMSLMDASAQQLVQRLDAVADTGHCVDMLNEMGNMTLQVVGSCAYGVDFGLMEAPPLDPNEKSRPGYLLASACKDWFNTVSIMTGSVYNRMAVLLPWAGGLISYLANRLPDERLLIQLRARDIICSTSVRLMDAWRQAHKDDSSPRTPRTPRTPRAPGAAVAPGSFLDLMMWAQDKQTGTQLTDLEVQAQAQTFILAGYETTANALSYALYCISNNPRVEAKLLAEIDTLPPTGPLTAADLEQLVYMEAVINEALRLYPPAPATTRELKEAARIGGYDLPKGTPILISINAFHHSPDHFKQPESFIPERFLPGYDDLKPFNPAAFMPFGAGTRLCIGYKFALQEAKAALAHLYRAFTFELAPGQVPLPIRNGITQSPANGVLVRVSRRPRRATKAA